ncbi:hypothetical protein CTI12_AA436230 [Artemisia annua]|uniref:RNA-directed DNA polymerase, eukaryota, Reverse transcriptase zinc-binding domain protein n=1 Tax=Artemisia annua TaxID=35608 RepID=A0A2U1LZJ2_ARTAN|nr:hypothetical protein CTI12_AA436230 [Artemisia annua]
MGDLGIGSLKAKNLSFIGEWCWRFNQKSDALWSKVVKVFHGLNSGFCSNIVFPRLFALEINKECLVSYRWKLVNTVRLGNWNWRYEPCGRVVEELVGLEQVLKFLTAFDLEKWQWFLMTNEKFTV